MLIYIIRHGETEWNVKKLLQGQTDIPLNDFGIRLAELTGDAMRGIKFDACISSPLSRAYETARLVLEHSGNIIPIQTDDRLMEISIGEREGSHASGLNGHAKIDLDLRSPGGETKREVMSRTQEFLRELAAADHGTVLVSTHGCALRCMLNFLYPDPDDFWQGMVPPNCAVAILRAESGQLTLLESDKIYYDEHYLYDRYKD